MKLLYQVNCLVICKLNGNCLLFIVFAYRCLVDGDVSTETGSLGHRIDTIDGSIVRVLAIIITNRLRTRGKAQINFKMNK